ncbi:hypothetical protein ACOME3_010187 [Neoechinorhynchus agilis]
MANGDLSHDEMACMCACLILVDEDSKITAGRISSVLKSANVNVEPFWPNLFARALGTMEPDQLKRSIISSLVSSGTSAQSLSKTAHGHPNTSAGVVEQTAAPVAVDVEPDSDSSDADLDMGFSIFD